VVSQATEITEIYEFLLKGLSVLCGKERGDSLFSPLLAGNLPRPNSIHCIIEV
jgi:hypothetical protein